MAGNDVSPLEEQAAAEARLMLEDRFRAHEEASLKINALCDEIEHYFNSEAAEWRANALVDRVLEEYGMERRDEPPYWNVPDNIECELPSMWAVVVLPDVEKEVRRKMRRRFRELADKEMGANGMITVRFARTKEYWRE